MKNKEQKSSCCQSSVRVKGEVTHFYSCDNCGKPCDVFIANSPEEQIIKKLDIFLANLELTTKELRTAVKIKHDLVNIIKELKHDKN